MAKGVLLQRSRIAGESMQANYGTMRGIKQSHISLVGFCSLFYKLYGSTISIL